MERRRSPWFTLFLAALILVFGYHLAVIVHYSIDIPTSDEWSAFWPHRLSKSANPSWWLQAHNEHRIVWTKIQIWILYLLDGWNLTTHKVINFFIYGTLLIALYHFLRKRLPQSPAALLPFFLFPLCTLPYENHTWGFQSCFHFVLLLLLGCSAQLFSENPTTRTRIKGVAFGLAALLSFASGVPGVMAILGVYALSSLLSEGKRDTQGILTASAVLLAGVGIWLWQYTPVAGHPSTSYPWTYAFWSFLANSISLGFGVKTISFTKSSIYLALLGLPWVILFIQRKGRLRPGEWSVLSFLLAVVAMLAVVGMGRAGSNMGNSKISRYTEFSLMLVPLTAAAWLFVLSSRKRVAFALAFFSVLAINHRSHFNYKGVYREVHSVRAGAKVCVDNYFLQGDKSNMHCPGIYPWELSAETTWRAWELEPSFIRNLKKRRSLVEGERTRERI